MTSPPDHRTATGFTLIEMLVVLVILGLTAVLLISRGPMRSPRVEARSTATRLLQGLRTARAQAIAGGQPVLFAIDNRRHLYRIGAAPPQPLPPQVTVAVEIGGHPARGIVFTPDGSSAGGRILLADAAQRLAVTVDWLSGRIAAQDMTPR